MTQNKGKIQPLSAGRFVMLWVIAHMLLFALRVISGNVLFPDPNSYELLHYSLLSMPINLLFTLITATIDFRLLRRFLRQSPRFWVQACMALAILSTLANLLIFPQLALAGRTFDRKHGRDYTPILCAVALTMIRVTPR